MNQPPSLPAKKRPSAWLGPTASALAFLAVQARSLLPSSPLFSFSWALPLVGGAALLALLGLVLAIRRLVFVTREPTPHGDKARLLAIVGVILTALCQSYTLGVLFLTLLFTIVPIL